MSGQKIIQGLREALEHARCVSDGNGDREDAVAAECEACQRGPEGETPHPSTVDYTEVVERLRADPYYDRKPLDYGLMHEAAQVIEAQAAEIERQSVLLSDEYGFVYHNPDTGEEYSRNHPIESGEVSDAMDVRPATSQEQFLYGLWNASQSENTTLKARIAELEKERDEAVRQERESCAFDAECVSGFGDPWTIETIAANIRARGPEDEKELVHVPRETFERFKAAESRPADAVKVIEEVIRLRLATDEGTLAKRADRMWEIACEALGRPIPGARSFLSTGGDSQ